MSRCVTKKILLLCEIDATKLEKKKQPKQLSRIAYHCPENHLIIYFCKKYLHNNIANFYILFAKVKFLRSLPITYVTKNRLFKIAY